MSDLPVSSELNERSKNDHAMIVGSEIRAAISELLARIAELETTLNATNKLYESRQEYIAELEPALAERDRDIKRLESCLRIWVGNLWPMATPEQNAKRIAVVKRSARAEEGSGLPEVEYSPGGWENPGEYDPMEGSGDE